MANYWFIIAILLLICHNLYLFARAICINDDLWCWSAWRGSIEMYPFFFLFLKCYHGLLYVWYENRTRSICFIESSLFFFCFLWTTQCDIFRLLWRHFFSLRYIKVEFDDSYRPSVHIKQWNLLNLFVSTLKQYGLNFIANSSRINMPNGIEIWKISALFFQAQALKRWGSRWRGKEMRSILRHKLSRAALFACSLIWYVNNRVFFINMSKFRHSTGNRIKNHSQETPAPFFP